VAHWRGCRVNEQEKLANEVDRRGWLRALGVLDNPPAERFNCLARAAQLAFDVPLAMVSLIDGDRLWFKACAGADGAEAGNGLTFCRHALLGQEAMVVEKPETDPRFCENPMVVGASQDELVGKSFAQFFDGETEFRGCAQCIGIMPSRRQSDACCDGEICDPSADGVLRDVRGRRADGTSFPMEVAWAELLPGTDEGFIATMCYLTEQRAADEALHQSETLHRSLFSALAAGVIVIDQQGRITAANELATQILGLRSEELQQIRGKPEHWLMVDSDGNELSAAELPYARTLANGVPMSDTRIGIDRGDGQMIWINTNTQALRRSAAERPYAVVASFTDVTEKVRIQSMKDEFVSLISHELRTPLTSVRGALGLLASGSIGEFSPQADKMLHIALTNADRLIRLVNSMLDIERLESGKVELVCHPVDLADIVTEVVESMQPLADGQQLTLVADVEPIEVEVDADAIIQTLTNLIGNAIKFSEPGQTIGVIASNVPEGAMVAVEDAGRGIPADQLEKVFGRFQQVDASDSRDKGGTGLGLAISRTIVHRHGGRIWVESKLGEGSRFIFTLPSEGTPPVEATAEPTQSESRVTLMSTATGSPPGGPSPEGPQPEEGST